MLPLPLNPFALSFALPCSSSYLHHQPPQTGVYSLLLLSFRSFCLEFWRLNLLSSIHCCHTCVSSSSSSVCSLPPYDFCLNGCTIRTSLARVSYTRHCYHGSFPEYPWFSDSFPKNSFSYSNEGRWMSQGFFPKSFPNHVASTIFL